MHLTVVTIFVASFSELIFGPEARRCALSVFLGATDKACLGQVDVSVCDERSRCDLAALLADLLLSPLTCRPVLRDREELERVIGTITTGTSQA